MVWSVCAAAQHVAGPLLDACEMFVERTCVASLKISVSLLAPVGSFLEAGVLTFEFVIVLVPREVPGLPREGSELREQQFNVISLLL